MLRPARTHRDDCRSVAGPRQRLSYHDPNHQERHLIQERLLQRSLLYKEIKSEQHCRESGDREFAGDSEEEQE